MKYRCIIFATSSPFLLVALVSLFVGCHGQNNKDVQKKITGNGHTYKSLFGDEYSTIGSFLMNHKDSVETKLWYFTNLASPLVLYGNFSDGIPIGDWNFALNDGTIISSQWAPYKNNLTKCTFSLPFSYEETSVDSNYFKLTTMNDSLGKISIIVGIRAPFIKEENLAKFGPDSEVGLTQQGYTFRSNSKEIKKDGTRYFFTEYFMKDSLKNNAKLYSLYGYSPSKKQFIEFTLFHMGEKEDLVKIIFNLIATSLYVENERFFNPYVN